MEHRNKKAIFALVLVAFGGASLLAVRYILSPTRESTAASAASGSIRLTGVVRDFKRGAGDFSGSAPPNSTGHVAANVATSLDSNLRPVFTGSSNSGAPLPNFTISNGMVTSSQSFAVMFSVIGAAIKSGSTDLPVTVQLSVGTEKLEPYGAFASPLGGNVNDAANPRRHIQMKTYAANTPVAVRGKSWNKKSSSSAGTVDSDWQTLFDFASSSAQCKVLRNGDTVPNVAGFESQSSVESYLRDYINTSTKKVKLLDNQAIFLFELGTTNMSSTAADWQDLVILVTLATTPEYLTLLNEVGGTGGGGGAEWKGFKVASQWKDAAGKNIAPHLHSEPNPCASGSGTAGTRGENSSGGISSAQSFSQWFADALGTNVSAAHTIELLPTSGGVYEYLTSSFYPIDGQLLGNQGAGHNYFFTFTLNAAFEYERCGKQFLEFMGGDGTWLFVDDRLVIDLGGVGNQTWQRIDMDRLGLADGSVHTIRLFYSQRTESSADFNLRTNIFLVPSKERPTVTAGFD